MRHSDSSWLYCYLSPPRDYCCSRCGGGRGGVCGVAVPCALLSVVLYSTPLQTLLRWRSAVHAAIGPCMVVHRHPFAGRHPDSGASRPRKPVRVRAKRHAFIGRVQHASASLRCACAPPRVGSRACAAALGPFLILSGWAAQRGRRRSGGHFFSFVFLIDTRWAVDLGNA